MMDESLRQELEELVDRPLWGVEHFPDRDLTEAEKWQIAFAVADQQMKPENGSAISYISIVLIVGCLLAPFIVAFILMLQVIF